MACSRCTRQGRGLRSFTRRHGPAVSLLALALEFGADFLLDASPLLYCEQCVSKVHLLCGNVYDVWCSLAPDHYTLQWWQRLRSLRDSVTPGMGPGALLGTCVEGMLQGQHATLGQADGLPADFGPVYC